MEKNYIFYRCYLERGIAGDGEPGLLAATEVVQAVCDAGFQRNGLSMKCYPSSPHCYYKYAKTPKEGMYMLRAVKKTDMTTLDILIDTRLYPCFVMIEKNKDWQEETKEVRDTLEQVINDDADQYNWHVNLKEYKADATQNLEEFISALSYIKEKEDKHEKHNNHFQIGQLILKVNGDNYYHEGETMSDVRKATGKATGRRVSGNGRTEFGNGKKEEEVKEEERFHFVHPEIEDEEAWRIHDAIKRLVAYQRVADICAYLKEQKLKGKLMLPSIPSVMYSELVRLGMPQGEGFSEKNFSNSYMK